MSDRHPIIAITGSSGAGTTSVTRTFENIFRRENVNAAIIEGDSFHRYDREEMKPRAGRGRATPATATSAISAPRTTCSPSSQQLFRSYARDRHRQAPQVPARRRRSRALRAGAGHLHAVGRRARRHRPAVLRRPARRGRHARRQRRQVSRPADRRGAGDQPGVDPEAAARQVAARLFHRGGHRHDPAAHARLRELHLPAVHAHARELPARAHGGHVQPVHRARDPHAPTRASW